jgi:hypothetical protein
LEIEIDLTCDGLWSSRNLVLVIWGFFFIEHYTNTDFILTSIEESIDFSTRI